MKNLRLLFLFLPSLFITNTIYTQSANKADIEKNILDLGKVVDNNEDFKGYGQLNTMLEGVEIVMLGEQSHGEATAYDTKIKLIKYLHEEMGYDILLFESGFYDCKKAWQLIEKGQDVRDAMGNSVMGVWSTMKDLIPLADYIDEQNKSETPLKLLGFDSQITGKVSTKYLKQDLSDFLLTIDDKIMESEDWKHFESTLDLAVKFQFKSLKKRDAAPDMPYIDNLVEQIKSADENLDSDFWIQTLKNIKTAISDISLKTDDRDQIMADNLIWIKEKNPDSKIICWGATSHFLYNSKDVRMKSKVVQALGGNYYKKHDMMGDYIKRHYNEKVYTIGFTAHEGEYGTWRRRKLKTPKDNSLEALLGQSDADNFLLPLKDIELDGYISRPLGNMYMKNDIGKVMDAVIFNRYMETPTLDRNFFHSIYPENKYIKPDMVIEAKQPKPGKA